MIEKTETECYLGAPQTLLGFPCRARGETGFNWEGGDEERKEGENVAGEEGEIGEIGELGGSSGKVSCDLNEEGTIECVIEFGVGLAIPFSSL